MKKLGRACLSLLLLSGLLTTFLAAQSAKAARPAEKLPLQDGWSLQSSGKVDEGGELLSTTKFQPKGWYEVSVPTTVFAALVKHKVYPDPDYGMNLRQAKGVTYPIGSNFSNIPMQQDSPYLIPWWYRKEFVVPEGFQGKTLWLNFGGINYRANIWLNGKQIADSNDVAGAWRTYEFNVTGIAKPGAANVLAVQVFSPTENDLAITFVDWNPAPPDKNMGLWRYVEVSTSGPVALRYPTVVSKVDSPANEQAHLTVTALLKNGTDQPVKGVLKGNIEKISFEQEVELAPKESKDVAFTSEQFAQLNLSHPELWWPAQMGAPTLHPLHLEFVTGGKISDQSNSRFGIRQVESQVLSENQRTFSINGKNILIRGGGWSPDMLLRENSQRLKEELRYVQDMGLNTIRLEGKLETKEFFDLADERGILIMAGWCCCDHWEHWPKWSPADFKIAEQSLRDQIYRLRGHTSVFAWLNGSDNPPPPDVEQTYLKVEKELLWPNPTVSSATAKVAPYSGPSGVKMTGPYEYVAPSYWTVDKVHSNGQCNQGGCGGAYGFNTETSMGPAVPPLESIQAMLPKEHWWPIDDWWDFHAGGGAFKDLHVFTEALNARFGTANSLEDYTAKAQMQSYEGVRAMFEAYGRNKYTSNGVIQWMLNNAWPSNIWHLYDFYLRPGGGYFGAKTAMQPLHPLYGYDDHSIWLVSSQYTDAKGLKLKVRVLNLDASEKYSQTFPLDAAADSTAKVAELPAIAGLSTTYFLDLRLEDAAGKPVGSNFYWLSTKAETLDWEKSNWYTTPTASYADYTGLAQLPKVKLKVSERTERKGEDTVTHVTVENPSRNLAFFVRLKVNKGKGGEEILPVLWQDNYISLLPGEKRDLTATYATGALGTAKPEVAVSGINLE
ncbi:MAG: beta galactosidase jelly roll domain-containing protein [Acidobacteria bacterium]|nr:beta galactosidase jelly roll domain-containing protein [Acidobacteriota bacterium]